MEEEMSQLISMGFSTDLAAQALRATGGNSTLKATEWLLSHHSPPLQPPPPPSQQPKLDKFFPFYHPNKRLKLSPSPPTPPPLFAKCSDAARVSEHLSAVSKGSDPSSSLVSEPLAERMRPRNIDQIVGQDHILGPTSLLTSAVKCGKLPSIVLWGPPGTGKTSIARALVNSTASVSYKFVCLSAVTSGVKDVREVVDEARKLRSKNGRKTVLFVDEVHRFNKGQQDSFLPVIEDGSIVFIGATTENPSFHLITPLLSRCRVLVLKPLQISDVVKLLKRAVDDVEIGLSGGFVGVKVVVEDEVLEFLANQCDGDARVALNTLEVCATTAVGRVQSKFDSNPENVVVVNLGDAKETLQCKHVAYDKGGEEHYNLISALIKSMRGSDGDAAIYWLARMLEGGEEPLFIARRLVVFASEDVGLADPNALLQAVACHQACHIIGMPECRLNLAQCVAYLALAPKSVAAYAALKEAEKVVRESVGGNEGVPLHLRNAPTKLMKEVGYGKGYVYTPDDPTAPQSFLPPSLLGRKFLHWPPSNA
ncbi:hypothetical protein RND81_13G174900 [Saponaria officinalis]|uniref:UBA domain-containing protein n=1 Tax=Saponaria officinalis TaxID=3572 RepID=A0AAW1H6M6_SAPOF